MPPADPSPPRPLRTTLFLLVVPLLLLGPILLAGERFLPLLPVGFPPLRGENPVAAEAAFEGANFAQYDRLFPTLSDQEAIRDELLAGHLPTWEPRQGMGAPLFAGSIAGPAYPPNWLAVLLPPAWAAAPLALLSLFLAGLGTWLFLRRVGMSIGAAGIGVLAYQLGGWGIGNLYDCMKVDAALWVPWALWAVEGIARGKRGSGPALMLSLALSILAGFVTVAVFGLFLVASYAAVRTLPWHWLPWVTRNEAEADIGPVRGPRPLIAAGFALLALAVASVQLLPAFEAAGESKRQYQSPEILAAQALPSAVALGTVIPDFAGSPIDPTPPGGLPVAWWLTPAEDSAKAELANSLEWNTFAGTVVVLLALTALFVRPRRVVFPALALVVVYGFACGWPGAKLLYGLPGLDIGAPGRVLSLAWFLWPWLAAVGAETLLRRGGRSVEVFLVLAGLFTAAAFFVWNGFEPERWAQQFETAMVERYVEVEGSTITLEDVRSRVPPAEAVRAGERLQVSFGHCFAAGLGAFLAAILAFLYDRGRRPGASRTPRWVSGAGLVVVTACAIAPLGATAFAADLGTPRAVLAAGSVLFLALLWWRPRSRAQGGMWLPIAAAVAIEGLLATGVHVTGRDPAAGEVFPESEAIEAVRQAAGDGRVWRYAPNDVVDAVELARPNMLEAYGISDLTPYIVFTPRHLIEVLAAIEPGVYSRTYRTFCPGLRRVEDLDHPILDLLRVQAVLARHPLDHPRLTPVLSQPGFHVYRREGAFGAARIVPRLVPSTSDDATLQTLHQRLVDPATGAVLAPEHGTIETAALVGDDWRAGTVETVRRPARNRMEYTVWGSDGGWLVMHEQHYPGWHAKVNGEEVPLLRVDHAFRAVALPPGDSEVEVWYAPESLRTGTLLCLGALLLAAVVAGRYRL